MMKRDILAVAIPALLVAGTANATEIYNKNGNNLNFYGKAVGKHGFTVSGQRKNTDSSYGQIGFKGETQISDQVIGYGQWEYRIKAVKSDVDQDNVTSLAFAGVKVIGANSLDYGTLDYGSNYGIIYDVESYTDRAPCFSGETWSGGYTDNYMTSRSTGLLTYRNKNFFGLIDGLNLGVQYQGKNERKNLKQANGDGIGLSLGYEFHEGFGLVGAYSFSNRTINQKEDGKGNDAGSWAIGAKYDENNIYLATVYAETRNMSILGNSGNTTAPDSDKNVYNVADKTQNFEVIAKYRFHFGFHPSISYVQSKGKVLNRVENNIGECSLAKYIATGATYHFNKNFNVYGGYRFNLLNNKDASISWVGSDNQATIGVTYQF